MRRARKRTNRTWRIVRNLLASVLILWLLWLLSGTPALTYGMLLRQAARENLAENMTVLYDEPWVRAGLEERRVAYLRSGNCFWTLRYTAWPYAGYTDLVAFDGGVLVLPSREGPRMLALGVPEEAVSAQLDWSILGADGTALADFCAAGDRVAPEVWAFSLPEDVTDWELERQEDLQQNSWPQDAFTYTLCIRDREGGLLLEQRGPEGDEDDG